MRLKRLGKPRGRGLTEQEYACRTINAVDAKLKDWVAKGGHRENYESLQPILTELDLTADELSFYCSRKLRKRFLTWRKELRINEAKDLIIEKPEVPICQIACYEGISDKSNFRHQFKSVVGCTPSEWRARAGGRKAK